MNQRAILPNRVGAEHALFVAPIVFGAGACNGRRTTHPDLVIIRSARGGTSNPEILRDHVAVFSPLGVVSSPYVQLAPFTRKKPAGRNPQGREGSTIPQRP